MQSKAKQKTSLFNLWQDARGNVFVECTRTSTWPFIKYSDDLAPKHANLGAKPSEYSSIRVLAKCKSIRKRRRFCTGLLSHCKNATPKNLLRNQGLGLAPFQNTIAFGTHYRTVFTVLVATKKLGWRRTGINQWGFFFCSPNPDDLLVVSWCFWTRLLLHMGKKSTRASEFW